jgi:hypothetical protein
VTELCNEPTTSGKPCNMKKGHPARFHRHREYTRTEWIMKNSDGKRVTSGVGINDLTAAIAIYRKSDITLTIEILC